MAKCFCSRHFLNYELPRPKGSAPRQPFVDAADVDGRNLWEESFDQFVDRKAGNSAKGFDVSFAQSSALVGLAAPWMSWVAQVLILMRNLLTS